MTYSLLGAHANATAGGMPEVIAAWKPPLVVLLDHSDVWHQVKSASPKTTFVGRIYIPYQPDFNNPGLDPIQTARDICTQVLPWAERMGATYSFWQGVNEPIVDSLEAMQRYADFESERARVMDGHGFRVVVGSFSVGNPHMPYWAGFLPALEAARQFNGALALHEYGWPTMKQNAIWLSLRHRKVYNGAPAQNWAGLPDHLKTLPLLITECGLDGLLEQPHPPRGWRNLCTAEQYLAELDWYNRKLCQDPYVAGAALYCCGTNDSQWSPYDIWPEVAQALAAHATPVYPLFEPVTWPCEEEEPEPPPPPPPGQWQMSVEHRPGARIIVGGFPRPGIALTITDPWNNSLSVVSGSKPEYGPGGFEALAPNPATYTLAFLDQRFQVTTQDGITFLTFAETQTAPPAEEDKLDQILARLDQIIAMLQQMG
ncbi:MAG: hypothetical protein JXM73_13200 [Anaerolineae bacterium]|nr:hypothetical protein [Anaerolineae bacterium]